MSRGKVVGFLVGIFLAGAVSGAVVAWAQMRHHMHRPPSPQDLRAGLQKRFTSELLLTSEQVQRLGPLLDRHAAIMTDVHGRAMAEVETAIRTLNDEMVRVLELTPDQRSRLETMERKRQEFKRHRLAPAAPPSPP